MNRETNLMREIMVSLSENGYIVLRQNSGIYYSREGKSVRIGFPGLSDLLVIRPDGRVVFLEIKTDVKAHRRMEQIKFINAMNKRGFGAAFVCSVEEALEVCRNAYRKD